MGSKDLYLKKGNSDTWITPKYITEALGPFTLDPCAAENQPWDHARYSYTEMENGLNQAWLGRVWMNPPYSTGKIQPFVERFIQHANGVALVFPRTETRWFQRLAAASDALFLMGERIAFCRLSGEPGGTFLGSVFLAIGEENVEALRRVSWPGLLYGRPSHFKRKGTGGGS